MHASTATDPLLRSSPVAVNTIPNRIAPSEPAAVSTPRAPAPTPSTSRASTGIIELTENTHISMSMLITNTARTRATRSV